MLVKLPSAQYIHTNDSMTDAALFRVGSLRLYLPIRGAVDTNDVDTASLCTSIPMALGINDWKLKSRSLQVLLPST